MMAVVEPQHVNAFLEICAKWDVQATVVGEVTDGEHLIIDWHGETVVDVPPRTVAHEGPVYQRPYARPDWQDVVQADLADDLDRPDTGDELAGSVWADVIHDHLGGRPPVVDFDHEQRLAEVLITAARRGLLSSAHDLADGGLAQAVVESSLRKGFGARLELPEGADAFVTLFSESAGRVLASLPESRLEELQDLAAAHGVSLTRLGRVGSAVDPVIELAGCFTVSLAEIRERWHAPIRAALGVS
jgi:phosphoribosylformylglycinamidine (FGAM) synthase-like enzyme